MKIAPLAEIKNKLSAYVDDCRDSPVIITKNGKPVAYLAPVLDEDDLDSIFLTHDRRFRQMVDEAIQRYKDGDSLSQEEFWQQVRNRRQQPK